MKRLAGRVALTLLVLTTVLTVAPESRAACVPGLEWCNLQDVKDSVPWVAKDQTSTLKGTTVTSYVPSTNCVDLKDIPSTLSECTTMVLSEPDDEVEEPRCNVATYVSGTGLKGGPGRVAFEWAGWCNRPIADIYLAWVYIGTPWHVVDASPPRHNGTYIYDNASFPCDPCDGDWWMGTSWDFVYLSAEEMNSDPFTYANEDCYVSGSRKVTCYTNDEVRAG